ncbi:MAG: glycine cleavage system aminomethyltransferase GcvT [Flavobacteriaceae bacterium]
MIKTTPLFNSHVNLGAKMVDFAGFKMPIQYQGITTEHLNVRNQVGIFDVSHMGEFKIFGKDSTKFLNYICSNNIEKISIGKAQYNLLMNPSGGIIDDLIVYRTAISEYMLVVNAANISKDYDWIKKNIDGFECEIKNISDEIGLISVQGPNSTNLLNKIFTGKNIHDLTRFCFKNIGNINGFKKNIIVSKTGYTGSLGYEIYIDNDDILLLWKQLLNLSDKYKVMPVGLGARDTLRLEMGYCLYGNDINDDITPFEANLMWATNLNKNFIGKEKLLHSIRNSEKRMINFKMIERGIPRSGYKIFNQEKKNIGYVTSGTFSPTEKIGIGIGYVKSSNNSNLFIKNRDKYLSIKIIKLPIRGQSI